ncbi:MAG: hypothetical protein IPK82_39635 [Polyangiaceae bacterium]|nr:hypothetical protein [Polyangiaceae bacterium]
MLENKGKRLYASAVFVGFGALVSGLFHTGCGPQPVGVESCRKIETARCEGAVQCGFTEDQVKDCKLLYHDQCLHGIENAEHRPTEAETEACVAAVESASQCAASGALTMEGCKGANVISGAESRTPCEIIISFAHELSACSFAKAEEGEGGSGGSGGSGGTAGTGGSGGGGSG